MGGKPMRRFCSLSRSRMQMPLFRTLLCGLFIFAAAPVSLADHDHSTKVEADATGASAAHGAEKAPLLPNPADRETQLHALWTVIIFLVLLAILYPTAWKNVLAGLKAREERIRK